jgi:excisionase family DNA binding protein
MMTNGAIAGREYPHGGHMTRTNTETSYSVLENALSELVRQAVRAEVQEIVGLIRDEDRLLTIDQVAERLSVSKEWIYRNGKRLTFTKKLGPKMLRFSEIGLQKWIKQR